MNRAGNFLRTFGRFLTNIFLLALCSLAVLAISELVVRHLYKEKVVLYPRYHTEARYGEYALRRIMPNAKFTHTSIDGTWEFVTNEKGFRNWKNFSYAKDRRTIRILALGDSHTQGYEARQDRTYPAIAERYLNMRGVATEVMNAAVSGFSTAEELVFLEQEGVRYSPDVVIVGFYANDYRDNIKSGLFRLRSGILEEHSKEYVPGVRIQRIIYAMPAVRWLGEHSYFYSLLFNKTWVYFKTRLSKKSTREIFEFVAADYPDVSEYEKDLSLALIGRMFEFCRNNGIKLILVDIPSGEGQVNDEQREGKRSPRPSLPEEITGNHEKYCDAVVSSDSSLGPYYGLVDIFVPHGHNHISEFTHAMLGIAIGKQVERLYGSGADFENGEVSESAFLFRHGFAIP